MGVWLDAGGEIRLTSCSIQQGVIVEQAVQVGSLHSRQNVLGHVAVKGLRVTLQSVKQTKGLAPRFNILGGKTGREGGGKKERKKGKGEEDRTISLIN